MPSTGALFGNSAARNQNKNLVEFKAGKMTMKGKMVHPDKRKGLLYVYQSDDSLMHFCWKDRVTGVVEDDLIIFPDDCEFKKVEQCTTGRVYVLKFKSSSRKFFFWIQEPKTDKDDENCKKIIDMLNNPPAAGSSRNGGHNPESDLQSLLGSMTQHQLMQLFGTFRTGGAGGLSNLLSTMSRPNQDRNVGQANNASTPAAGTATTTSSDSTVRMLTTASPATGSTSTSTSTRSNSGASSTNQPIQLSDLQKYLSNLTQSPDAQISPPPNVDLSDALNSESIASVLNDPSLIRELSPHLPNIGGSESTEQQLRSTIMSPQFQQAVSMFSAALQSGHLGPVVQQFQVGENAVNAAREGNMEEFVKALQNTSLSQDKSDEEEPKQPEKKKKTDDNNKEADKKDDDDDMALG